MNGILCIDKPTDYTSFDVIARLRGMTKQKRIGHAGTLDPMATGVLPIFMGYATKACDILPNDDKAYRAEFLLGKTTDTLDITGTVLSSAPSAVKREELERVLCRFTGEILQQPPMYSAVRVNGQRLYDLARQGLEVKRASKQVTIHRLELLDFDEATQRGSLFVSCSKGTYIRTIISDVGEALGVGGVMTALRRTQAGVFTLEDCITLEEAQELSLSGTIEERLRPVDSLFAETPTIRLNQVQTVKFCNGVKLDLNRVRYTEAQGYHRVYGNTGLFLGLASLDPSDMGLKIEKMFCK